jgi:hypothetical protein
MLFCVTVIVSEVGFVLFTLFCVASCCFVLLWCWPLLLFFWLSSFCIAWTVSSLLPPLGISYALGVVSQ